MPPRRLERHPLTGLDRGPATQLHFDGRAVPGFEDEPVAAALLAHGERVLSRSMRYHRARGYFCGTGNCTHCFVNINGQPNQRSCLTTCEKDQWIEGQNAYPNVRHDLLGAADVAYPNYLDAHHAFVRPRFLRPFFTKVIRGMAGFGRVPAKPVAQTFHDETLDTDVCVVGSGPAGLAAAEAARDAGRRVLLLEREPRVGGRLRYLPTPFHATVPDAPRTEGKTYAGDALARLQSKGVEVRSRTRLFGIYPGTRLAAASPTKLVRITTRALVLATGAYDDYRPFPGSDRAGVLLAAGALKLLNQHGILPGEDAIIVGAHRSGLLFARDLMAAGGRVEAIIDPRLPVQEGPLAADLRRMGIPIQWSTRPYKAVGRTQPSALVIERGARRRIPCDTIVLAGPRHAAVELAQQAGCKLVFGANRGSLRIGTNERGETSVPGVFAAGSAAGAEDEWRSVLAGRVAGAQAARLESVVSA